MQSNDYHAFMINPQLPYQLLKHNPEKSLPQSVCWTLSDRPITHHLYARTIHMLDSNFVQFHLRLVKSNSRDRPAQVNSMRPIRGAPNPETYGCKQVRTFAG